MRYIFLLLLLSVISFFRLSYMVAFALEAVSYEKSEPYISLSSDKEEVVEADQLTLTITYGNRGPESAEKVKIILNQPLGGRSPLQFLSSQPSPDGWINSEYGNLAEYMIEKLDTFEATREGKIKIKLEVRDSVAAQILTPTANLQAPRRDVGKRLVVSDSVFIKIKSDLLGDPFQERQEQIATESLTGNEEIVKESIFKKKKSTPATQKETPSLKEKILISESIWTTGLFLIISSLLILSFVAGRKSIKK